MEDDPKHYVATENIFLIESGKNLIIEGRQPPTIKDTLKIGLSNLIRINYKLVIDDSQYIGLQPYLLDKYKNIEIPINGIDTINFNVDTSIYNTYQNRFSIIFKSTILPIGPPVLIYNFDNIYYINNYPNPIKNILNIRLDIISPSGIYSNKYTLYIYDLFGNLVLTKVLSNHSTNVLKIDDKYHGVLIMKIINDKGVLIKMDKIIKI